MKHIKKITAVLLCAVLLFSLAACGTNTGENKELQKITLSLDWTPNTNHTGIYVALAKGYFKDAGLDVTVVQPSQNGAAAAMCAAGQAQFAIEFQDTLAAAFATEEPLGITAVAALLQHNTSGILSRKGEGLDKPRGLENHTYATWDSPIEQAMLKSVVETDGGDFSKVKLRTTLRTKRERCVQGLRTRFGCFMRGAVLLRRLPMRNSIISILKTSIPCLIITPPC